MRFPSARSPPERASVFISSSAANAPFFDNANRLRRTPPTSMRAIHRSFDSSKKTEPSPFPRFGFVTIELACGLEILVDMLLYAPWDDRRVHAMGTDAGTYRQRIEANRSEPVTPQNSRLPGSIWISADEGELR